MICVLVTMYVLSALLPLLGLVRLLLLARREARPINEATPPDSGSGVSWGQLDAAIAPMILAVKNRPRAVLIDLGLIGTGVVMGAIASIWSLFL